VTLRDRIGVDLENLNREPEHAEIRYLAHDLEECRQYFGRIQSPALGWAFTVNHAHLVPEGGGYRGHYMMAFGSLDDMLRGRDDLLRTAP
jgi:hypothetical protein